jgi:hypothetical protein
MTRYTSCLRQLIRERKQQRRSTSPAAGGGSVAVDVAITAYISPLARICDCEGEGGDSERDPLLRAKVKALPTLLQDIKPPPTTLLAHLVVSSSIVSIDANVMLELCNVQKQSVGGMPRSRCVR